ncbi:hypothetical protein [Bifidobacterium ruminantium]|jgi:hypothetical protein|uniref:hypothetical protein n=1 Tax=Bifidobacterium ruminantium TaxID=78346 RepID=UPI001FD2FC78|nr:hypothetical protein [Bifidobacterium ruminantium]
MTVTMDSLSDSRSTLARLCLLAVRAADKTWKGVDPRRVRDSWRQSNTDFLALFATLQARAAADAMDASTLMLAEQGDYVQPDGIANPLAYGAGYAPSGIDLDSYFDIPVTHTLTAIKSGLDLSDALQAGRRTLRQMAMQALEDTSVSAMGVSITQRAGVGYVRVESPDCCPRCAILAGKYYRHNQGFLRHPKCHGRNIPCKGKDKAAKQGWITNPMDRFNAMGEEEQDRIFGHAYAQAIRDGADIYQVVNAHRGMRPVGRGRISMTTSEGTSRYGWSRMIRQYQYGQQQHRRLTPEGIYSFNLPREQTIELLKREGYILPDNWRGRVPDLRRSQWLHNNEWRQGRHEELTAAQKRLENARLRYEAALDGRNPYQPGVPVTPDVLAKAENSYRRWLASNGEVHTK